MIERPLRRAVLAGAASALLLLGGCVVAPAGYYDGYGPVVNVPPPAPRVEVYGAPPVVGSVWIGGYWGWRGGGHVWVPGRWDAPRPGYRYVPHAWTPYGGGWRERPGHWDRW